MARAPKSTSRRSMGAPAGDSRRRKSRAAPSLKSTSSVRSWYPPRARRIRCRPGATPLLTSRPHSGSVVPISSSSRYTLAPGGCETTSSEQADTAGSGVAALLGASGAAEARREGDVARSGSGVARAGGGAGAGVASPSARRGSTGAGIVVTGGRSTGAAAGGALGTMAGGDSRAASSSTWAASRRRSSAGSRAHFSDRLIAERAPGRS